MKVFEFINHACIKCEKDGLEIITDPWIISNAFGNWYQHPSPIASNIFDMIETDEKLGVIISHGHDDHLDDWFIKQHLNDKMFFCSKFATPGLEKRLSEQNEVTTETIGEGKTFGSFKLSQFVNPDFTEYDAIITIETSDFLIIHANDNWHTWPEAITNPVKEIVTKYDNDNVFLLIQFGVADCFPVNYEGYSEEECLDILANRFRDYLGATEHNMRALGITHMYYYANQSRFNYKVAKLHGISMYDQAQKYLEAQNPNILQLLPGMSVYVGHKIIKQTDHEPTLFEYCLKALENFINKAYRETAPKLGHDFIEVRFIVNGDEIIKDRINYSADIDVWNRILIGELTLEAITIGGAGVIHKPNVNIRDHHMFISKRAYVAQNLIKNNGLFFYKNNA